MEELHARLDDYLHDLARHRDPLLEKMEERAAKSQFPIIGPIAGRFCYQVARMLKARRIFELGSGFGYSTLWFARAVAENGGGEVYHTVWDEELSNVARSYLNEAGLSHLVHFRVSEAVQALRESEGLFDVIFNDIEKDGYPASLPVIKGHLRPGGALLVDNMFWGGRVFDPRNRESSTAGVREVTRLIYEDPDWFPSMLPLRDGVLLALKKE